MTEIPPITGQPTEPSQPKSEAFFKDSVSALRELRKLQPPLSDEMRAAFAKKVKDGPMAKSIAFSLLAMAWSGNTDARWNLIKGEMRTILLGDMEYPEARHLSDPRSRQAWLEKEFDVQHRTTLAKTYLEELSYLRPLYIILANPDNEPWLNSALTDFQREFDGLLEIATNRPPKKTSTVLPANRQLAVHLARQIPHTPKGIKIFRSHLRVVQLLTALQQERTEHLVTATQQVSALDRLLEKSKAELAVLEKVIENERTATAQERLRADNAVAELKTARDQQKLQKGVADARMVDELSAQRASIRKHLQERIQNIRLYSDRPEPAKDKIARLCDEIVAFLNNTPPSPQ